MTDQKSNERDGQPEAVQSPEITTAFSSLEKHESTEDRVRRLIGHHVQRAKQLERDFLRRRGKQDQSKPKLLQALKR